MGTSEGGGTSVGGMGTREGGMGSSKGWGPQRTRLIDTQLNENSLGSMGRSWGQWGRVGTTRSRMGTGGYHAIRLCPCTCGVL